METSSAQYDLIILGAGPAGMTASVYAARKQLKILVITKNVGGQATWSSGIENYLGFMYISGTELVAKFQEHLESFNISMMFLNVTGIKLEDGIFTIETDEAQQFTARAVIVASGKSPRMLNVPGEVEYRGRGVVYCATCDGPLFSGLQVAVVGGGNSGLDAAFQLMKICPKVYLIESSDNLRADEIMQQQVRASNNVEILTGTRVTQIFGDKSGYVDSITVTNDKSGKERKLEVKGIFIEIGLAPNTGFLKNFVSLNEYGEIIIDCAGRTGVPGLYAAGDVTNVPEKQIIIAAGDGAKAALEAYSYLVRHPERGPEWLD
jgi:NADH-dependent peroxiredoxin subunit F